VALAVIDLYTEGGMLAQGQVAGRHLETRLAELSSHPLVGEARFRGLLAGVEIVADKATRERFPRELKLADRLFARGYQNGVIFRAFADDIIGLAPALCCSTEDIDLIVDRVRSTLDDMLELPEVRAQLR